MKKKSTLLYPSLLTLINNELLQLLLVFWRELREVDALVEGGAWLIHWLICVRGTERGVCLCDESWIGGAVDLLIC